MRTSRRGTLLLAVLVCLIVATSLLTAMVQSALASRRQVRSLARLAQVELLLQSGFDRAVAQITADSEYRGETWRLPAVSLAAESLAAASPGAASPGVGGSPSGAGGAEVTIQIEPSPAAEIASTDGAPSQVATIVAEYPAGQIDSVRRTRRYELMSR